MLLPYFSLDLWQKPQNLTKKTRSRGVFIPGFLSVFVSQWFNNLIRHDSRSLLQEVY